MEKAIKGQGRRPSVHVEQSPRRTTQPKRQEESQSEEISPEERKVHFVNGHICYRYHSLEYVETRVRASSVDVDPTANRRFKFFYKRRKSWPIFFTRQERSPDEIPTINPRFKEEQHEGKDKVFEKATYEKAKLRRLRKALGEFLGRLSEEKQQDNENGEGELEGLNSQSLSYNLRRLHNTLAFSRTRRGSKDRRLRMEDEEPVWTNRFDLDLPPEISMDKSEIECILRIEKDKRKAYLHQAEDCNTSEAQDEVKTSNVI